MRGRQLISGHADFLARNPCAVCRPAAPPACHQKRRRHIRLCRCERANARQDGSQTGRREKNYLSKHSLASRDSCLVAPWQSEQVAIRWMRMFRPRRAAVGLWKLRRYSVGSRIICTPPIVSARQCLHFLGMARPRPSLRCLGLRYCTFWQAAAPYIQSPGRIRHVPVVRAPASTQLSISNTFTTDRRSLHINPSRNGILGNTGRDCGQGEREPPPVSHRTAWRSARAPG